MRDPTLPRVFESVLQASAPTKLQQSVPDPRLRLSIFREDRLRRAVRAIGPTTRAFRDQVDVLGAQPMLDAGMMRSLNQRFSDAYGAFSEALEAGKASKEVHGLALSALSGVTLALKNEYLAGLATLATALDVLDRFEPLDALAGDPSIEQRVELASDFVKVARTKIERLQAFWEASFPHLVEGASSTPPATPEL